MVYISRIMFRNFKSFSGSLKLSFQQGFNVITGPNGSGKSNIIDAVQFVFGELGSKRMRVPDLSGLIFDGAGEDGSKPQYAQITIYFNNNDRALAVDRKTVSVGRRVDRDGKSKYYLNGKQTSRRALLELLMMAGISPGGYNMVLQGFATRLSDLNPSERMNALEDLVGITEYDEKKAEARGRLNEAERKIEVASAKGDEVRRRVMGLERERNDAIRSRLLEREEKRIEAYRLSDRINKLETSIGETKGRIAENGAEIERITGEREKLLSEREGAREKLEEFTNEASVKGNTQLPILRSEFVEKQTVKRGLENRLREFESRKLTAQGNIETKRDEIERSKAEKKEKQKILRGLVRRSKRIDARIAKREEDLKNLATEIETQKELAEYNLKRIEQLTEDHVPMQESLSGLEIEINKQNVTSANIGGKIEDLERKKRDTLTTITNLEGKIGEYEDLKVDEAAKLEEMLGNIEGQVGRQKGIRDTIQGANKLAKDAELSITQFMAKRDLWKNLVTEEKAQARIVEMAEAGALKGYHGLLRSLVKIDLKYQKAANTAASGWSTAVVVADVETAIECIEGLKKNKLGMTRFIPLEDIRAPEPLPSIDESGVEGYLPDIVRFDEEYRSAVYLVWGDTYVAKDRKAAMALANKGIRSVTLAGDLFEPLGGLLGGHWRRPPDFTKLIPSEESIDDLSITIKALRKSLSTKMADLKKSGGSLREFTGYIDHFNKNIDGIDQQIRDTVETIERYQRNVGIIDQNIAKLIEDNERELGLIAALEERKARTLHEIDRAKKEITQLRGLGKLSEVAKLERSYDNLARETAELRNERSQIQTDVSIQTTHIDGYLNQRTTDIEEQIDAWKAEIKVFDENVKETSARLAEVESESTELQGVLDSITSEVEATSKILEQHRRAVTSIERQIERLDQRRVNIERRTMSFDVELEKLRLQSEQCFEDLARLSFEDMLETEGVNLAQVERTLQRIAREKRSLGMVNQLAIEAYEEDAYNYKMLSVRINELEEEKGSILKFIEEVEKEKTEHFMAAYNDICENFSVLFEKLTGGGDGRLELQDPESPFTGGVDLYVQFPGKPMRLAAGASGGERSVAAIAYLLAIQRFLKAPFYLFDEIDAHLDDLNTARLADVLKENAMESQFLMVSLKDVMVHNADKIYGVFAQQGRSRVVALPMKVEVPV
jgi:chromosome segregation protein